MFDVDRCGPLALGMATDQSGGFSTIIPVAAEPTGDGIIDIGKDGAYTPQRIKLVGIAVGSDDDAYTLRVFGWQKVISRTTPHKLWVPHLLASIGFVVGTSVGVANTPVGSTYRFADTVTIISGGEGTITSDTTRDGTIITHSPTGNLIGFAVVPLRGFEKIQFDTDDTTGTPTMNVLYGML